MKPLSLEFQALLDAAVDAVILLDQDGHLQAFNPAAERSFGYQASEVLGSPVSLLISESYSVGIACEVTARRKDGSVFPACLSVSAVATTAPPCFLGFIQDISARRHAEDDAHRLLQALTQVSRLTTVNEMSAGIAHEINQPLTAVANYAQACDRLLGLPDPDIEEIRGALKQITAQAVRAGEIIRRLRSLARNDIVKHVPTNINASIEELAPLIALDTRVHRVSYQLELGNDLAQVQINRAQIQQVILNLVRNAVESMTESAAAQPEVAIRTSAAADGAVEITISDNGPGVLRSIEPRLFDPFCTTKPHGAGLGLAIGRRILKAHEGSLDYRPGPAPGACFVIRLPGIQQDQT